MIRALAAVKPMSDAHINNLGISTLENFCDEMMPSSDAEGEAGDEGSEGLVGLSPLVVEVQPTNNSGDTVLILDKPKRSWKRKIYPVSAVHRSARVKQKKKFHDEV